MPDDVSSALRIAKGLSNPDGASAPLDMSREAREERAKKQGFTRPVFHETTGDAAKKIAREGFSLEHRLAGAGDYTMPIGVFTKPTGASVGIGRENEVQMPLLARPGRAFGFRDSDELQHFMGSDPAYRDAVRDKKASSDVFAKQFDDVWAQLDKVPRNSPEMHALEAKMDDILERWKPDEIERGEAARVAGTDYLRSKGVDSVMVENDKGTMGRSTSSQVFLNPGDLRSAFDEFHPGGESRIGLPRPGDFKASGVPEPENAPSPEEAHKRDLDALTDKWDAKGVDLSIQHSPKRDLLTLSKVVVPKEQRGEGVGTAVMNDLTAHADKHGKTIALTPSTEWGATSVGRLKDFYKQFGFVENKGPSKDFSIGESMYRPPSPAEPADASPEPLPRAHGGATHMKKVAVKFHKGPIHSAVQGRTDHLPMTVKSGSYVLPADVVSAHGEGNTVAGFKVMRRTFGGVPYGGGSAPYGQSGGPYGEPLPRADGGDVGDGVEIVAAGGEYVLSPEEVTEVGNGDMEIGHRVLDEFVKRSRAEHVKTLQKLPGPAQS